MDETMREDRSTWTAKDWAGWAHDQRLEIAASGTGAVKAPCQECDGSRLLQDGTVCTECAGTGQQPAKVRTCATCDGSGKVRTGRPDYPFGPPPGLRDCPDCKDIGSILEYDHLTLWRVLVDDPQGGQTKHLCYEELGELDELLARIDRKAAVIERIG